MEIGQTVHNFELVSLTPVEELKANLHLFRHRKTGTELLWTGRADENKTFSIAFQTIPEDDTGVFHILEHSVLCGSKKYPVKEPFVELLKGSMNTFLNAITFPDKTMYPVSSRNNVDFRNLMHVYLDAVFCPEIYNNENIFRQEGWHYEMDPETGLPKYVGVVFGEMKGAFSSVDEVIYTNMMRKLYGESCYGFCSGGDPKHIPDLTYEQFINTHRRFYHPTNSKIFLDGSVDLDQVLADIDQEYLSSFTYQAPNVRLEMQDPQPYSCSRVSYAVAPDADSKNQAHFAMGKLISTWRDREKNIAISALQDYLAGSNSAPLTRAVLERGLGQNVEFGVETGIAQCFMLLEVRNTSEEKLAGMDAELRSIVHEILKQGLDRQELMASLNRMEFRSREEREPRGLHMAIAASQSWMYGGDPAMYLEIGKAFENVRAKLNGNYFEDLLQELLLDETGMSVLHILPSATLNQEEAAQEQARLKAICDSWSEEDRKNQEVCQADLAAWQQAPNTPDALATIPHITHADIPLEPLWTEVEEETVGCVKVLHPKVATSGTVYLNLMFAMPGISMEDLRSASFMTNLLGELPTERSAGAVKQDMKMNLGGMSFHVDVVSAQGDLNHCTPYFRVSVSVLESKVADAIRLVKEILLNTKLNTPEQVNEILQQTHVLLQQNLAMGGHVIAFTHAASGQSAEGMASEQVSGYTQSEYVKSMAQSFESSFPELLEIMERIRSCFTAQNLTLGVTGTMTQEQLAQLCNAFPQGEEASSVLYWPTREKIVKTVSVPAGISFTGSAINLYGLGASVAGKYQLMSKLMSLNYLWNEVRVQGGAYGTGMVVMPNGTLATYSFRDPNPARTLDIYQGCAEFLCKSCQSGESLDQLIIGTISDTEPLDGPAEAGKRAVLRKLRGVTLEQLRQERQQILECTAEQLLECCQVLEALAKEGGVCVVGGDEMVKACAQKLNA